MEKQDEEKWFKERRQEVLYYLSKEGVTHGEVSEYPAWDVVPYTSVWPIESKKSPGSVGWWVVCGDHPTDYVSAGNIKEPRQVYEEIAKRWLELCDYAKAGKKYPSIRINLDSKELIEMLRSRAKTFLDWIQDDEIWIYE